MAYAGDAKYVPIGESSFSREDSPHQQCSTPRASSSSKDHHGPEDGSDNGKKSVMAKVKDKAKKWKNTLVRKKHGVAHRQPNGIAHGLAGLVEEEEDDADHNAAPVYEPEMTPNGPPTESAINHKKESEMAPNGALAQRAFKAKEEDAKEKDQEAIEEPTEKKTLVLPREQHDDDERQNKNNHVQYDKGVSVKEYLIQKLEPGEGEKALSEVITVAINPNKSAADDGEKTVVEMVKEVVSSFLGTEEPSIPVSTEPHQEEIEERKLQTNE